MYHRTLKLLRVLFVSSVLVVPLANAGFAVAGDQTGDVALYSGNQSTPMPRFLSKAQAEELEEKTGDKVRIAYNIDHGKAKTLAEVPDSNYFYYNPYSQIISAAVTSQDAIDLAPVIPRVYFVVKGDTLSDSIDRWAREAGYQLEWEPDYDSYITYSYTFHGDLIAPRGPLDGLLQSYRSKPHPFKASVMKNGVIDIKENSYVPSAVIGY